MRSHLSMKQFIITGGREESFLSVETPLVRCHDPVNNLSSMARHTQTHTDMKAGEPGAERKATSGGRGTRGSEGEGTYLKHIWTCMRIL